MSGDRSMGEVGSRTTAARQHYGVARAGQRAPGDHLNRRVRFVFAARCGEARLALGMARATPSLPAIRHSPTVRINMMKAKTLVCAAALLFTCALPAARAQIAGIQPLGGTVEETNGLLHGWSVRKALVDEPVYNDTNDKIGSIYDLIIAPDRKATYAVLSVGG